MAPRASLASVLAESQRVGLIGPGDLADAVAHAQAFVAALVSGPHRVVDVGSGGGLPGLVIADRRPDVAVTLVDRRGRACDVLRRAVRALGWVDRVRVVQADLADLGHDPAWRASFDAATARGVGSPSLVAELVLPLIRPGGRLVVSVAGEGEQWPDAGLARLGARVQSRADGLLVIAAGTCPEAFPRARPRPPVFDPRFT